jgi:hypothetical protein
MLIGEILEQESKLVIVVNLEGVVPAVYAMMKKVIDCRSQS